MTYIYKLYIRIGTCYNGLVNIYTYSETQRSFGNLHIIFGNRHVLPHTHIYIGILYVIDAFRKIRIDNNSICIKFILYFFSVFSH